ncbi:hypothetical protein GCM10027294_53350 [Marinactinospora endophytica]
MDLPDVLAQAVRGAPTGTPPQPEKEEGKEEASPPGPPGAEIAVPESQTAADVERTIRWLGVTYRPPDVWRERQPSLAEEFQFAMDGSHLPESGPWRAAARAYAAPALAVCSALHIAIWILRSPARHATAWLVVAAVLIGVYAA